MDQTDIQALFDHIKHIDDDFPLGQYLCGESNPEIDGFCCTLALNHEGKHCGTLIEDYGDKQSAMAAVWD